MVILNFNQKFKTKLSNFFNINSNQVVDIPIPVELGVAYNDKFKNYDEIIEWFENYE